MDTPTETKVHPHVCRCKAPGASKRVQVRTPDGLRFITIDACISDIVYALGRAGVATVEACCGHNGASEAFISLADGRRLVIT